MITDCIWVFVDHKVDHKVTGPLPLVKHLDIKVELYNNGSVL
jgi:hypothetical protein